MYILKYKDNWADEIDVDGTIYLTELERIKFEGALDEFGNGDFYIGTNEWIAYDSKEDLMSKIRIIDIAEGQLEVLFELDMLVTGFGRSIYDFVIYSAEGEDE